jgi:hypothetical protein
MLLLSHTLHTALHCTALLLQVLIDETSRARYDKQGKAGFAETEKMDGAAFFTMVFGSEKFENLVGEMKVLLILLRVHMIYIANLYDGFWQRKSLKISLAK